MKLFELKQVTETAGDCTTRYNVIFKKSGIKVKEFVDYIVKEMTTEWGDIEISTKKGKDALWDYYAESIAQYSKGKLISKSSEFNQYSEMIILEAYACGEWSMMEYILVLDMSIKKNETTKTYEQGLADAWEVARKMCKPEKSGGMTPQALIEIFSTPFTGEIITENTAAEVIAKIKAYEEKEGEKMKMHKYKKGDKFIVEIEDVYPDWVKSIDEKEPFYKLKNLNAISLRECHLNNFDKIDETKAYEQGLADAWEAAREIAKLPFPKAIEIFGMHGYPGIVGEYSAIEVISKIKAYEEKQQNIDVGDEIIDSNGDKCVITHIFDNWLYGISQNGRLFSTSKNNKKIKKTGRHFPQVEEMLTAMRKE